METPREVELKLECEPHDLAALASHPLLHAGEGRKAALLDATYFDTRKRDLHEAALSLRVRNAVARHVQTLKAASASVGLFDRPEWEWDVSAASPDTTLLRDTPAAEVLGRADSAALEPIFRTLIERTGRTIRYRASAISVTLDSGRVETDKGDAPVCELELELEDGISADLFALARTLGESVPLRLGTLSKGERGYALVTETLRRPSKAARVALRPDITTGEAFVAIARACLKHLRLNEAVFRYDRDPEALHQMRVALRRLRSVFSLFKPMLREDATALDLAGAIKRVAEPFGTARNLDVFLTETLAAEMARRPDEPSLDALRERLAMDRDAARDAVITVLDGQPWCNLVLDLVAWIEAGAWRTGASPSLHRDRPAADFAAEVLERLRRRIKKRGRHLAKLSTEERHRVRISAKKLRYGAEFFGSLFAEKKAAKRHKRFVGALSDLQDHLGALNDLASAHAIATSLVTPGGAREPADGAALFAAGLTAADGDAGAERLIENAAEAHVALLEVRPFWR